MKLKRKDVCFRVGKSSSFIAKSFPQREEAMVLNGMKRLILGHSDVTGVKNWCPLCWGKPWIFYLSFSCSMTGTGSFLFFVFVLCIGMFCNEVLAPSQTVPMLSNTLQLADSGQVDLHWTFNHFQHFALGVKTVSWLPDQAKDTAKERI